VLIVYGHLLSDVVQVITSKERNVYLFEWQLAGQLCAQHDHPGHPEEEDVTARLQDRVGVELLEVGCLLVNGRKTPQSHLGNIFSLSFCFKEQ